VVTYEVVISAPNEDLKLKPGLTASVSIITSEATGALCVSNKALRFTPSEAVLGEGEQIIDCDAENKVWIRDGKNIKAVAVTTGVTNGTQTEITSGLEKGQAVIVEMSEVAVAESEDEDSSSEESNPFMPSPPGSKSNKK
jgi:HlyD family secretion protein